MDQNPKVIIGAGIIRGHEVSQSTMFRSCALRQCVLLKFHVGRHGLRQSIPRVCLKET
jgi:hypothetical protein